MSYNRYEEPSYDTEYRQKLDINFIVNEQIRRCKIAEAKGDDIVFSNSVEGLLALLPRENRERLESPKFKELYVTKVESFEYRYSCGHKMGSPERPIFRNNPLDWNYHGGPPELVSPIAVEVEQTDYQKLFNLIMSELQDLGVTWKVEPKGNIGKRIDAKPTPVFSKPQPVLYLEQVEVELEDEYEEDIEKMDS